MKHHFQKYKKEIWNKSFIVAVVGGFILLGTSLVINYYAGLFATHSASNSVTDIILDNLAVRDVDAVFIYGTIFFWLLASCAMAIRPQRIPFILKSIALFIFIRSVSVSLTHIAPFPGQISVPPNSFIRYFTFGGDLFFSGHTGLPFLLALLFWPNKKLRFIFLTISIVFACVVLLGHYHYSIDVFAAFFITPTIAHLARIFFNEDYQLFLKVV
jgi:hypothetical protein